jgi:hypothetical protein
MRIAQFPLSAPLILTFLFEMESCKAPSKCHSSLVSASIHYRSMKTRGVTKDKIVQLLDLRFVSLSTFLEVLSERKS